MRDALRHMIVALCVITIGYWMGYWHGRTYELYESAKRYGVIPATMTWGEFVKQRPSQ